MQNVLDIKRTFLQLEVFLSQLDKHKSSKFWVD